MDQPRRFQHRSQREGGGGFKGEVKGVGDHETHTHGKEFDEPPLIEVSCMSVEFWLTSILASNEPRVRPDPSAQRGSWLECDLPRHWCDRDIRKECYL